MTTPREEQPQTEVPATPTVTTAPPRARWRFANVPSRLGRARTSTVVLAVLFVAFFVLWVYVRPEAVATPAGTTTGDSGPVAPASSAPATTSEAPATTTEAPTTTAPSETTESSTPTDETTTAETTTPGPSSSTSPRSPTSVGVPTPTEPAPTS